MRENDESDTYNHRRIQSFAATALHTLMPEHFIADLFDPPTCFFTFNKLVYIILP